MLFDVLTRLRQKTDAVIVGVSRGKDSLALLDLCKKTFPRVEAYYMYLVRGMSFAESYLGYLERRYQIHIERRANWWLSFAFRKAVFRPLADTSVPKLTIRDIQAAETQRTGIAWHVTGEKACDSLQRRGMLSACDGISERCARGVKVAYPLWKWANRHVYAHLRKRQIPLPADYRVFGNSMDCSLADEMILALHKHFPEDYQRVRQVFPLVEAVVFRAEEAARRAAAAERRAAAQAQVDEGRADLGGAVAGAAPPA